MWNRLVSVLLLLSILGMSHQMQAQDDHSIVTTFQRVFVFAGPSPTYAEVGTLQAGVPVRVVERNQVGNWVRIQLRDGETITLDGWIIAGYLNNNPDLRYGDIPVTTLADANPERVNSRSQARLYAQAIIPQLSQAMIDVFDYGQVLGNHADGITKVGDSNSVSEHYINIFNVDDYVLGSHAYLEETLRYYRQSTQDISVAAQVGMSSFVMFDPMWADNDLCQPQETVLACEYRLRQPSIAFIQFGHNDVRATDEATYHANLSLIIEAWLAQGTIPVLMTFANHPDDELFWQGINLNLELVALADEYDVPLINLWAASQHLPNHGLEADHVHLTHSGFDYLKYDSGHEAFYGVSLENLLVLVTLDHFRTQLGLE